MAYSRARPRGRSRSSSSARTTSPPAASPSKLRDGAQAMHARTGPDGLARFDGLRDDAYELCAYELDRDAWEPLRTLELAPDEAQARCAAAWNTPVPGSAATAGRVHKVERGDGVDRLAFTHGLFPATIWTTPTTMHRAGGETAGTCSTTVMPCICRRSVARRLACEPARATCCGGAASRPDCACGCSTIRDPCPAPPGRLRSPASAPAAAPPTPAAVVDLGAADGEASAISTFVAGHQQRQVTVSLGGLTPARGATGWRQRLQNLGFDCGHPDATALSAADRGALLRFQELFGLPLSGEPDAATLDMLHAVHDLGPTRSPTAGLYASGG